MADRSNKPRSERRRAVLTGSVATVGALGAARHLEARTEPDAGGTTARPSPRAYNGPYQGQTIRRVAFPLGGMGAGMICLEGTGALSHVSLRHRPEIFNEPCVFAAVSIEGAPALARVLEGPVPSWKKFGLKDSGNGAGGSTWGLPRFSTARFDARFPFGTVSLEDDAVPLTARITGWSPFVPGDPDSSSLPVAALEYRLHNPTSRPVSGVFSLNARNFMKEDGGTGAVRALPGGFILWGSGTEEKPWEEGSVAVRVDADDVRVNHAWFRGGWWDGLTIAWKDVTDGACFDRPPVAEGEPAPGATLFVPFTLAPGTAREIAVQLSWYVGASDLRYGEDPEDDEPEDARHYRPWYSSRFAGIEETAAFWRDHYAALRGEAARFSECFYDTTLPPEVVEAVAANLTILKSPTVLRQADGRLWCWEGCGDSWGCCHGSCTHVWNYAQALPHLFPSLERTLRETEFRVSQDARGHQTFRAALPIRPAVHDFHAAADGQLGGIMKVHREWRIRGDTEWLRRLWPQRQGRASTTASRRGTRGTPGRRSRSRTTTRTTSSSGARTGCAPASTSARCRPPSLMGEALGDDVPRLRRAARRRAGAAWRRSSSNGEYFIQKVEWKNLRAGDPLTRRAWSASTRRRRGRCWRRRARSTSTATGCLSDGVLGAWMAAVCGVGEVLDPAKARSHLRAVHRHNLKTRPLRSRQPAAARPSPAATKADCCSAPGREGGELSLPFVYSQRGLDRHRVPGRLAPDAAGRGRTRGSRSSARAATATTAASAIPFNEYECGHWYARAMSSLRAAPGPDRRALRRGGASPLRRAPHRGRLPQLPLDRDRLRHGGRARGRAVSRGALGHHRGVPDRLPTARLTARANA